MGNKKQARLARELMVADLQRQIDDRELREAKEIADRVAAGDVDDTVCVNTKCPGKGEPDFCPYSYELARRAPIKICACCDACRAECARNI